MKIGVLVPLTPEIEAEFQKVVDLGLPTCQLCSWQPHLFTPEMAQKVIAARHATGIEITAFWCGWEGPKVWNFIEGPQTLGLVPPAYRAGRLQTLIRGADFAHQIGVSDLVTHVGFIPENPNDPEYPGLIAALQSLANHCRSLGLHFLFETGQETPVTLLRAIEDIGLDNLGVNLDTANLILYGKANPVDALDVFGTYVRGVHAKDGLYPTNGRALGAEKALGQGKVDFARVIARLKQLGYEGALTIEREISGPEQIRDIQAAKTLLEGWLTQEAA
jgi:sugar phosphate isomerase/epimerase